MSTEFLGCEYGWVDRQGGFHECRVGEHRQLAKQLLRDPDLEVSRAFCYGDAEQTLEMSGWIKLTFAGYYDCVCFAGRGAYRYLSHSQVDWLVEHKDKFSEGAQLQIEELLLCYNRDCD